MSPGRSGGRVFKPEGRTKTPSPKAETRLVCPKEERPYGQKGKLRLEREANLVGSSLTVRNLDFILGGRQSHLRASRRKIMT